MDTKIVNKRYIFLTALLVVAGVVLLLLPEKYDETQLAPEQLLLELNDDTRFLSTDEVTHRIIDEDPSLQLIDVRKPAEYAKFRLPGAINIPLDSLLNKNADGSYKWEPYLNQNVKTNVFYSNGTVYASQAWMLCRRMNFLNNYIMKGGLNKWYQDIMLVQYPANSVSSEALDLYHFRAGARQYFGGGSTQQAAPPAAPEVKVPQGNATQKPPSGGGC